MPQPADPRDPAASLRAPRLVVGAVMILVLAAAAIPWALGLSQAYRLRTAAWQLAGELRLTRQKAVSTLRRHRLVFAEAEAAAHPVGYRVERLEGGRWVPDSGNGAARSLRVQIDPAGEFAGRAVTFDERGMVPRGGSIRVRNPAGSYAVRVDPGGRVMVCACRAGTCC